jgi:uncharacterized membrane protein YphA (DoxX/SURF4 family)
LTRPSETISAVVGSILGAVFIIVGYATGWDPPVEVVGAITLLVSWIAAGVTWYVARRQRSGELLASPDGTVTT